MANGRIWARNSRYRYREAYICAKNTTKQGPLPPVPGFPINNSPHQLVEAPTAAAVHSLPPVVTPPILTGEVQCWLLTLSNLCIYLTIYHEIMTISYERHARAREELFKTTVEFVKNSFASKAVSLK